MGSRRVNNSQGSQIASSPALTPEERESVMIGLTMDLVEQRLRDGSASSSETVHFLKLASSKQQQENEKLKQEVALLKAKTKSLESYENMEKVYTEVLDAFKLYGGHVNAAKDEC